MRFTFRLIVMMLPALSAGAQGKCAHTADWATDALDKAAGQVVLTAQKYENQENLPCSIRKFYSPTRLEWQLSESHEGKSLQTFMKEKGYTEESRDGYFDEKMHLCTYGDWRSGFFPGSLWLVHALTGDSEACRLAKAYTNKLNDIRYLSNTHDLGFMSMCSYGNALKFAPADSLKPFIIRVADNLCTRFNPVIGCIRSWNGSKWNYPVIIDNMMNLELLFWATKETGDPKYRTIAISHADRTIANHFRPDYTSYHVVSYNDDGTVECKNTHQGYHDESSWSRGQSWGLYGFTMCYRETGEKRYLEQAEHIASTVMERVTTEDRIPYWDYDAVRDDETPRDASAAAVTASALLELASLTGNKTYYNYAESILKSLSGSEYLASPGTNCGFVIKHATTTLPTASEVDASLNYADYYYLEALYRYLNFQ